jgi:hypothetical protein
MGSVVKKMYTSKQQFDPQETNATNINNNSSYYERSINKL